MSQAEGRYHHGNLREELLAQAHALLNQEGLSGVSLRKVAARAGVSRTAPYHHFPSKEDLLAALVQRGFQELVRDMRQPSSSPGPVIPRFEALGRAYVAFALREPALYRLMFGARMLDKDKHPETACIADEAFDICCGLVAEGQQKGEVSGDQPLPVAMAAWSTVHGLASLLMDKLQDELDGQPEGLLGSVSGEQIIEGVLHTLSTGLQVR